MGSLRKRVGNVESKAILDVINAVAPSVAPKLLQIVTSRLSKGEKLTNGDLQTILIGLLVENGCETNDLLKQVFNSLEVHDKRANDYVIQIQNNIKNLHADIIRKL